MDDFSAVAALAQTARIFYHTWRRNPTSICRAIAPHAISNFTNAKRLLDIQEEAEVEAVSQSQDHREQKSIIRAKRLLSSARCASAASECWVDLLQIQETFDRRENRREDPYMRLSKIVRFKHVFYGVWALGVMAAAPYQYLKDRALAFLNN